MAAVRLIDGERLEIAKKDSACDDPNCQLWWKCHPQRDFRIDYTQIETTDTCTVGSGVGPYSDFGY